MPISPDEVDATARLARLALTDEERARMTGELDAILGYIDLIRAVDVTGVPPTTHAVPLDCPLRADEPGEPLPTERALALAPRRDGDLYEVPRVIARE